MKSYSTQCVRGFTMIEMMVVIAILAIVAMLAAPSFEAYTDTQRLKGATEDVIATLQLARSEAIKRNTSVSVNFSANGTSTWCYGMDENISCNCNLVDPTNANACALPINGIPVLKATTTNTSVSPNESSTYRDITIAAPSFGGGGNTYTTINPTRGTADAGTITLTSDNGRVLKVIVSALGRVRVCTPTASTQIVTGYSTESCP